MKNKKTSNFPAVIITFLSIALVIELILAISKLAVPYDQKHYYENNMFYDIDKGAYSNVSTVYYSDLYKEVKPSADYTAQKNVGAYYINTMLAKALEHTGDTEGAQRYYSKAKEFKALMGEYAYYSDDIDTVINQAVINN